MSTKTTSQPTLWIDMTDLSKWKGHFTGVQRVVYEIARRYDAYDNTKFFVYDDGNRQFYEMPFSVIENILTASPEATKSQSESKKVVAKLAKVPKALYVRMPEAVKEHIPKGVKSGTKLTLRLSEKVARTTLHHIREARSNRLNSDVKKSLIPNSSSIFNKNDAILLMGASWDSDTKMTDIALQRVKYDLKFIQVIHDVIPSFYPHLFGPGFSKHFNRAIFESLANADLLLTVSDATKKEVVKLCKVMRIQTPLIETIRLGDDFIKNQNPTCPDESLKDRDYILCVGTYEIRKNHTLLYYAVREAQTRGVQIPKIVIVGRKGWLTNDLTYILEHDPHIVSAITRLPSVNDQELAWLYENCQFTIFPAMFEGWGLPVGESLFYGKPCLSSNVSSMPEIGGDLVDYFSPYDSGACLEAMLKYGDKDMLSEKARRIKDEYKPRQWDDTFAQVEKQISNIL